MSQFQESQSPTFIERTAVRAVALALAGLALAGCTSTEQTTVDPTVAKQIAEVDKVTESAIMSAQGLIDDMVDPSAHSAVFRPDKADPQRDRFALNLGNKAAIVGKDGEMDSEPSDYRGPEYLATYSPNDRQLYVQGVQAYGNDLSKNTAVRFSFMLTEDNPLAQAAKVRSLTTDDFKDVLSSPGVTLRGASVEDTEGNRDSLTVVHGSNADDSATKIEAHDYFMDKEIQPNLAADLIVLRNAVQRLHTDMLDAR